MKSNVIKFPADSTAGESQECKKSIDAIEELGDALKTIQTLGAMHNSSLDSDQASQDLTNIMRGLRKDPSKLNRENKIKLLWFITGFKEVYETSSEQMNFINTIMSQVIEFIAFLEDVEEIDK